MTSELKPCPFCGGEAYTTERAGFVGAGWSVECVNPDCGCDFALYADEAEAIAAWNTRAYTNDEITLSGTYLGGLPIEDIRVFGMTLDEVRQMMKRDAERERTCHVERSDCFECSECAFFDAYAAPSDFNYCPQCGAKVVE